MPDILFLREVKKTFAEPGGGVLPILDIPEFRVAAGEQVVLVGRSGSGKTTLLHTIAGISRPDSGLVQVDGIDITRLAEAGLDRFRADKIGYVFQTFNLLPAFSAVENVLLGMAFASGRPDERRARMLLERVGLGHRLTHKPPMLSVGEQQRVAVARALGEPAEDPVGGRADGERGHAAPAAGDRAGAGKLSSGERGAIAGDACGGSGRAV